MLKQVDSLQLGINPSALVKLNINAEIETRWAVWLTSPGHTATCLTPQFPGQGIETGSSRLTFGTHAVHHGRSLDQQPDQKVHYAVKQVLRSTGWRVSCGIKAP